MFEDKAAMSTMLGKVRRMETTFTGATPQCPLSPFGPTLGAWVFDPVSLQQVAHIAGGKYPRVLGKPLPDEFSQLAEITVRKQAVTATIETGLMEWDERPDCVGFYSYDDSCCEGLDLDEVEGRLIDSRNVIRVPMTLSRKESDDSKQDVEADEGQRIYLWCAEYPIPDPDLNPDAYDLLLETLFFTANWVTNPEDPETVIATIPQLKIDTECDLVNLPWPTRQVAKIKINQRGAEVFVSTTMCTGLPGELPPPPREVTFGERSAVLTWFSSMEDFDRKLPFAIALTTADSWIERRD